MPRYQLVIDAEFTSEEPLSRGTRRKIVSGLKDVYVKEGVLQCDVEDISDTPEGIKHIEKTTHIRFEPIE